MTSINSNHHILMEENEYVHKKFRLHLKKRKYEDIENTPDNNGNVTNDQAAVDVKREEPAPKRKKSASRRFTRRRRKSAAATRRKAATAENDEKKESPEEVICLD